MVKYSDLQIMNKKRNKRKKIKVWLLFFENGKLFSF